MKELRIENNKINIEEIKDFYFKDDENDAAKTIKLKEKIESKLDETEKVILALYLDYNNLRDVGRIFNTSHSNIGNIIKRIKAKLI